MKKYLILALLKGPVSDYQKGLVNEIVKEFPSLTYTKEAALETHFTIKHPFQTEDIFAIESLVKDFTATHSKTDIKVGGFHRFDDRVVFVDVKESDDARRTFKEFIRELKKIESLSWEEYDGEDLHFHVTLAQKCEGLSDAVMEFLAGKEKEFEVKFDNITILEFTGLTPNGIKQWKLYKSFEFKR